MKKTKVILGLVIGLMFFKTASAEPKVKLDKTDCLALLMTIEKNKWRRGESIEAKITRTASKNVYDQNQCADFFKAVDQAFKAEKKLVEDEFKVNIN